MPPADDQAISPEISDLDRVICEYLTRVDAGESISQSDFLEKHPLLRDDLLKFFEGVAFVHSMAGFQSVLDDTSTAAHARTVATPCDTPTDSLATTMSIGNSPAFTEPFPIQFGQYRVLNQAGQGAMGAVYVADDLKLHRKVALKVPLKSVVEHPEHLDRFMREAQACAQLRHHNICPIYEVNDRDGIHYIAMAFIEGKPLAELISQGRQFSGKQIAIIIRKIARALELAHQAGIIHRDLKPANIMIDRHGEPIVMDFGLARHVESGDEARLTQEGMILGTPAYMSPEQVRSELTRIGPASDVYSLGVILYELLCGKLPFTGSLMALLMDVANDEKTPPKPSAIRPNCDRQLEQICLRMVSKRMGDRYHSMKEVAAALTLYVKSSQAAIDIPADLPSSAVPGVPGEVPSSAISASSNDPAEELASESGAVEPGTPSAQLAAVCNPATSSTGPSPPRGRNRFAVLAAGAAAFLVLCGVIIITITDKDGKQQKFEVADTSKIEISKGPPKAQVPPKLEVPPKAEVAPKLEEPPTADEFDFAAEKQAAEWIKSVGGTYASEYVDSMGIRQYAGDSMPAGSYLIRVGINNNQQVDDDGLANLSRCRSLREATITSAPKITARGIAHLKGNSRLEHLDLSFTGVGDELADSLKFFPQLRYLSLNDASHRLFTDEFAERLPVMRNLRFLRLNSARMTDAGLHKALQKGPRIDQIEIAHDAMSLAPLSGAKSLRHIGCDGEKLTDQAIRVIQQLPELESLTILSRRVKSAVRRVSQLQGKLRRLEIHGGVLFDDEEDFEPFVPMSGLRTLIIYNLVRVDDAILRAFAQAPDLRELKIQIVEDRRKYTPEGIAAFRAARPDIHLIVGDQEYPSNDWPLAVVKRLDKVDPLPQWQLPAGSPMPVVAKCQAEEATILQQEWARYLKRPVIDENKIGMKFAVVPPGEFPKLSTRTVDSDVPPFIARRRFRITKPFAMLTTEVTWDQFRQFVDATGYKTKAESDGLGAHDLSNKRDPTLNWRFPGWKPEPNEPVTQIVQDDADAFCRWLSDAVPDPVSNEKVRYRLPTEAEWIHACRAGSVSRFVVGNNPLDLTEYAWSREFWEADKNPSPLHIVASKRPNPFGLYDTLGNVWEFTADELGSQSFDFLPAEDPRGLPTAKVVGYSWSISRNQFHQEKSELVEIGYPHVGFRVLKQFDAEPLPGLLERPLLIRAGHAMSETALVRRPSPIAGLRSWSVEFAGPAGLCEAIAWHPGGRLIATPDTYCSKVFLWSAAGKLERVLLGMKGQPCRLAFSPDGKWLAVGERLPDAGLTHVFEVASGVHCAVFDTPGWPEAVRFSPNSSKLGVAVIGGQGKLAIFDLKRDADYQFVPGQIGHLSWSIDGLKLLAGTVVLDSGTMKPIKDLRWTENDKPFFPGASQWSPNGQWLAGDVADGTVRIWETAQFAMEKIIQISGQRLTLLDWTAENQLLLRSSNDVRQRVIRWDVLSGKVQEESIDLPVNDGTATSPDGTRRAHWIPGRLEICDLMTGQNIARTSLTNVSAPPDSLSPDGKEVASARDGEIWFFNVSDGSPGQRINTERSGPLQWSPDGTKLLKVDGQSQAAQIIDRVTGTVSDLGPPGNGVQAAEWMPDSKRVATGSRGGIFAVWDVTTKQQLWQWKGADVKSQFDQLRISSDGGKLASTQFGDHKIMIWDLSNRTLLRTIDALPEQAPHYEIAWVPNSDDLWVSMFTKIVKVDAMTGNLSEPEFCSGGTLLDGLAVSPDGRQLLVASGIVVKYRTDALRHFLGAFGSNKPQWLPDNRRAMIGGTGIQVEEGQRLGSLFTRLADDHWLCIGLDGNYRGSPGVEEQIIYVAMHDDGSQHTYTPKEFAEKFGWTNRPERTRLLKLDGE